MQKKLYLIFLLAMFMLIPNVYYASCEEGQYEVTYDSNGGKEKIKSFCTSDYLTKEIPTKDGYAFLGWGESKDSSDVLYSSGDKIELKEDITLYAIWSRGYKITYNANGGSLSDKDKVVYKGVKYGSLKTPSRKGYTFLGWYISKDSGELIDEDTIVTNDKSHTIYAHWTKTQYKMNYELNGGVNNDKNRLTYDITTNTFKLESPSKRGYAFKGWFFDTAFKKEVKEIKKGSTGNKTVYAKWSKNKYSINYELNGGTNHKDNYSTYTITNEFEFKNPSRKGYSFDGWYSDKELTKKVTGIEKGTVGKKTFYAKWNKIKYTMNYELNGGVNNSKNRLDYYVTTSTFKLESPSKKGYLFKGWFFDTAFKKEVKEIKKGSTGNKTVYAKWAQIKYNIKYYGNGNTSGSTKEQNDLKYDIEYKLNSNGFKKNDFVFDGWNTRSDGNGTKYTNNQTIKNLSSSNNQTVKLYAMWKRVEYTINYELDGGVNPSDAYNSYNKDSQIILKNPSKKGYSFEGWYLDSNYKTKITEIKKGSTGNKTVYAKWTIINYYIFYYLDGGINNNTDRTYTINDTIILKDAEKKDYQFVGWYTENTFENKIERIEKGSTGDIRLYAKFEVLNRYKISYELDGGKLVNNIDSYTEFDSVTLPIPTKDGYNFDGWYTENTYENKVDVIEKGNSEDKLFYAKWSIANYKITYELDGGSLSDYVSNYTILDEVELLEPRKDSYTFDGWYLDNKYEEKVEKIVSGSYGNKTLYAKWNPIKYNITYELDDGIFEESVLNTYTILDEFYLPIPEKKGYDFIGWYTENTYEEKVEKIEKGSSGDKIFYAKWQIETVYKITYELDGGELDDKVLTYTKNDEIILNAPIKEGSYFEGWFTESDFINKIEKISKGTTGDIVLYAKWKIINNNSKLRDYSYIFYNYEFDNKISSSNDIKLTIFNILNSGKDKYSLQCDYDTNDECFNDFFDVVQDSTLMKSINDYVNPLRQYNQMSIERMGGQITLYITYSYDENEIEQVDNKLDEIININKVGVLTDIDKIKFFHDYLVNTIVYDEDAVYVENQSEDNAYYATGALLEGSAVCQGYSDAMAIYLDRFQIPNLKVSSDTHTWNLVYINDEWLHLDVTWDDPIIYRNGELVKDNLSYNYYLIGSTRLHQLDTSSHTYNSDYYLETNAN